jgi:hypothetical protein
VTLGRLRIHGGYSREDTESYRPVDLSVRHDAGGGWQAIPGATVRGNAEPVLTITFPPVVARRIRVEVESSRPDARGAFHRAALRELEAFGP